MLLANKKVISYIILTLICLQSLGFALPGNIFVAFFMPITAVFLLWHLLNDKFFINNIINLCRYSPFIYLLLFYVWSIVTVIVAVTRGLFSFGGFLTGFVGGLTFSVICVFLTVYILLKENYIDLKSIIKFLTIFYLFVFAMGIIQFIGNELNNEFIRNFAAVFNNKRAILFNQDITIAFLKNRVQAIFDEPGGFGAYLYAQLPIMYSIVLSKYKIFCNKILNLSVKVLLIPLAFLNLILTLSPMSLILTFIVTVLYFYKFLFKFLKKYYLYIVIALLILTVAFYSLIKLVNIEETYIKRIILSLPNLFNLEALILVEPSLATRIINYLISIKVGLSNFLFGIGYGSLTIVYPLFLKTTSLPLTKELIENMYLGTGHPAVGLFYRAFAETGAIGIILLLTFYYRTLVKFHKTQIKLNNIIKDFHYGLFISMLFQSTVMLFYGGVLHNTYNIILFSIAIFMILNRKYIIYNYERKNI